MKKKFKRILTLAIIMIMIIPSVGGVWAKESDFETHWAKEQLGTWVSKGLLKGYDNGNIKPNDNITRAEFFALINRIFGFSEKEEILFTDVDSKSWFAEEISKAVSAGYVEGYPDKTIRPKNFITREEAAVILVRVFDINTTSSIKGIEFKDMDILGDWSKDAIKTLAINKYINGYPDQTFRPKNFITRAEAVVMMDNISGNILNIAGDYEVKAANNVVINKSNIVLRNSTIKGNLYLTEGIGEGEVTLDGVTVQGKTIIRGGGEESIIINNSKMNTLIIDKKNGKIRIVASGDTEIENTELKSGAKLEEKDISAKSFGFDKVEITEDVKKESVIKFIGDFGQIKSNSEKIKIEIIKGEIEELSILGNVDINLGKEVSIKEVIVLTKEPIKIQGEGKINSVKLKEPEAKIEVDKGITIKEDSKGSSGGNTQQDNDNDSNQGNSGNDNDGDQGNSGNDNDGDQGNSGNDNDGDQGNSGNDNDDDQGNSGNDNDGDQGNSDNDNDDSNQNSAEIMIDSILVAKDKVTVTGAISVEESREITLKCINKSEDIIMLDQVTTSDEKGNFKFIFTLSENKAGKYIVYIGGEGVETPKAKEFEIKSEKEAIVTGITYSMDGITRTINIIPNIYEYVVNLPYDYDTSTLIIVGVLGEGLDGNYVINQANTIPGEATITIKSKDETLPDKVYTVKFVLEEKPIDEDPDKEPGDVSVSDVVYDTNTGIVKVLANINPTTPRDITIKVEGPNKNINYINQNISGSDGSYELKFKLGEKPLEGTYNVYVGGEGVETPKAKEFEIKSDKEATVTGITYSMNGITRTIDIRANIHQYVVTLPYDYDTSKLITVGVLGEGLDGNYVINQANTIPGKATITIKSKDETLPDKVYTVKFVLEEKPIDEDPDKEPGDVSVSDVVYDTNTGIVKVLANINPTTPRDITIKVEGPDKNINYINQNISSNDGSYEFKFKLGEKPLEGTYNVYIGGEGVELEKQEKATFTIGEQIEATVTSFVYQVVYEDGNISDIVEINIKENLNDYSIGVAKSVKKIKIKPILSDDNYTYEMKVDGNRIKEDEYKELSEDSTEFIIEIISQEGTTKPIFSINVNKYK